LLTKNRLIIAILGVCIILSIASTYAAFTLYQENKNYEKAISSEIATTLNTLLSAIMDNEEIFDKIIDGGKVKLSPDQASNMCYNFETMSVESQNLFTMATDLNKYDSLMNNTTANMAQDIHFFLARLVIGNGLLGDCSLATADISLDEEKTNKLIQISDISTQLAGIVRNRVPEAASKGDTGADWNNIVNDKIWVELIKDLSVYANDSGWIINQFFN